MPKTSQYPAGVATTTELEEVLLLQNGFDRRLTLAQMLAKRQALSTLLTAIATLDEGTGYLRIAAGTPTLIPDPASGGYDPAGTAADVMTDHLANADPHPQYLTQAEADAAFDALGAATAVAALLATHETVADPHSAVLRKRTLVLAIPIGAIGEVGLIAGQLGTKFRIDAIQLYDASAAPVLAQVGFYSRTGATGTTLVTPATITGMTTAATLLPRTLAGTSATTVFTTATDRIFANVTVANAAAMTITAVIDVTVVEP